MKETVCETEEKIMNCPYFREAYFAICVAKDVIHVPSIDEMERFCFRTWHRICPQLSRNVPDYTVPSAVANRFSGEVK
jgi:hypothetical protein